MKMRNWVTTLSLLGLLAGFGPASAADRAAESADIRAPGQKIATREDHEMVATYYENTAREAQAKLEEQKQLLDQYENKSYLYGRQAQDLQSQADALIRKLQHTVDENVRQAALHRQMAQQLPDPNSQKLSAIEGHEQRDVSTK
jgi:hypothetical protein